MKVTDFQIIEFTTEHLNPKQQLRNMGVRRFLPTAISLKIKHTNILMYSCLSRRNARKWQIHGKIQENLTEVVNALLLMSVCDLSASLTPCLLLLSSLILSNFSHTTCFAPSFPCLHHCHCCLALSSWHIYSLRYFMWSCHTKFRLLAWHLYEMILWFSYIF